MIEQEVKPAIPFNLSKYLMMGAISLLLCFSMVMTIFAPFPIAFVILAFGRRKGYALGFVCLGLSLFFSQNIFHDPTVAFAYAASLVVAVGVAEIVLRKISPVRGMVKLGAGIIAFVSLLTMAIVQTTNFSVKETLVNQINQNRELFELQQEKLKNANAESGDTFDLVALLSQPEVLADEIIKEAPSYFFMGTFLVIWVNLFLLLRSNKIVKNVFTPYTELALLRLKVPEHFIWVVIGAFVMYLWGESLGELYPVLGMNILKVMGIFYFFQGFGIYLSFLDYVKMTGILRTILVMLTIFTAAQVLAFIGLFDMFVNFRRFFKKNKNQGES
jgi:hypothetical protein